MHSTLSANVKGFIDEIKHMDNGFLFCKGWTFYHKKMEARPLRLVIRDKEEILIETSKRIDVGNYYHTNTVDDCGWEFTIDSKDGVHVLQIDIYGKWHPVFLLLDKEARSISEEKKTKTTNSAESLMFKPKIARAIPSLIVVDNFYENPDEVRKFALSLEYKEHPANHKGKRTDTCYRFEGLQARFEDLIGRKISNFDCYGTNACFQICLGGDQIVYHKDLQQYAGVLFLTPNSPVQGGTAFYKSKHTGKMKVNDDEHEKVFKNGFLDSSQFEMVDRVGNIYNRLVLFDAQMLHSGLDY